MRRVARETPRGFARLRFEHQILLLPVLAVAGFVAILAVVVAAGTRTRHELELLRTGYAESLQTSRDLGALLQEYQRALLDAVAASEPAGLERADSLARAFEATLARGRSNRVVVASLLDDILARFQAHDALARRMSGELVAGASVDDVLPRMGRVTAGYAELRDLLARRTQRDTERIAAAYREVGRLSRSSTRAIVLVLVIVVAVVTTLSQAIARHVRSSMATVARAAERIGQGDLRGGVEFGSQLAMESVAKPFHAICEYIEGIAAAADRLARGDLRVAIIPRSEQDAVAQNLRQAIADRLEMEQALRESEEQRQARKLEAIGRLAGGIAHDFNNLLTAIQGHTALLSERLGPDHEGQEELGEVRGAAERAGSLTRQLLAYGRKQVLHPKLLDLNGVVDGVSRMLRPVLREDIEVRVQLTPDPWLVRIDPSQIEQVLVNLVLNARDALPTGGVITISTSNLRLPTAEPPEDAVDGGTDYVVLEVSDNGVGMDHETRDRLFEPFFTTRRGSGGSGLGLATVYGIVQQSGGQVKVESEPGAGSRFEIRLPRILGGEAEQPVALPVLAPPARGSEVVLVAEDEDAVRSMVVRALTKRGYAVLSARSGMDALEVAARHAGTIDVLLTDVVMPELGGRELAEELCLRRPGIPVLFMSGYSEDSKLVREVFTPGVMFLEKPFAPDALARKLRAVLDGRPQAIHLEAATV